MIIQPESSRSWCNLNMHVHNDATSICTLMVMRPLPARWWWCNYFHPQRCDATITSTCTLMMQPTWWFNLNLHVDDDATNLNLNLDNDAISTCTLMMILAQPGRSWCNRNMNFHDVATWTCTLMMMQSISSLIIKSGLKKSQCQMWRPHAQSA